MVVVKKRSRIAALVMVEVDSGWDETDLEVDIGSVRPERPANSLGVITEAVLLRYQNETLFRVSCMLGCGHGTVCPLLYEREPQKRK